LSQAIWGNIGKKEALKLTKVKCIGIIAEDDSDYEAAKAVIKRIANKTNIPFKKAIGDGCGKLRRKASSYAIDLSNRGCDMLILIHDLDRNNLNNLRMELEEKLIHSPIVNKLICIPIEEIEGWYLSDPEGLKKVFKLQRKPKVMGNPETIQSPKEKLEELIYSCSGKNVIYLNTKHNKLLAENLSIELMNEKCQSFHKLHTFIKSNKFI
jgi:hypothetical protein